MRLRDCTSLRELPAWLKRVGQLNLRGCANVATLPAGLIVTGWLDLGGTRITQLPKSLTGVSLRWRGIPISPRIAFQPESITAKEILGEKNAELRRVLLERMGFEQFLTQAKADVLNKDRDAGGERRLLRVRLKDDEDLVCVSVFCPSTARQYLIRVPPTMTTCRQAIAWTAGFDNPDDYRPLVET